MDSLVSESNMRRKESKRKGWRLASHPRAGRGLYSGKIYVHFDRYHLRNDKRFIMIRILPILPLRNSWLDAVDAHELLWVRSTEGSICSTKCVTPTFGLGITLLPCLSSLLISSSSSYSPHHLRLRHPASPPPPPHPRSRSQYRS